MKSTNDRLSTGLPGLDKVLGGLIAGDNVVWEIDRIEDYLHVVGPLCNEAGRLRRRTIYFRFARHPQLIGENCGVEIHKLNPEDGFEKFLSQILDVIENTGKGAFYIFDCLSELAAEWFSDRMLGNFFRIVCPYLYKMETITYFALLKNHHSFHATDAIIDTAQVIIEVFRNGYNLYIYPIKVWKRHSPTLYTLHIWKGEDFKPVTNSAEISEIFASAPKPWTDFSIHRPGIWMKTFLQAQDMIAEGKVNINQDAEANKFFHRLIKMVLTRDARMLKLVEQNFTIQDIVEVMKRMIGTGLIGGKSLGMLLARAIIRNKDPELQQKLEIHDSFYIGADVFYTYLVENGCWWLRKKEKDFDLMLKNAELARKKILEGDFPDYIKQQFKEMLGYFGQSPIIVRSSSLLEDNYGNAFSGKYESVFCANQGTPQERLEEFMKAVKIVYASTMSEESLIYRKRYSLLEQDEQMALLVQRVSGEKFDTLFFPHIAGVAYSFNPFVWNENIDPKSGVVRLVFGLGTRAVDRTPDDYSRIVALNAPERRPEARTDDVRQFAQRRVDLIDLKNNSLVTMDFENVCKVFPKNLMELFAEHSEDLSEGIKDKAWSSTFTKVLTFDKLLSDTEFVPVMQRILKTLEEAYNYPVDIEFTANFSTTGEFKVNLLQCRPFQVRVKGEAARIIQPEKIENSKILIKSTGPIVGRSLATSVDMLIYIAPKAYSHLSMSNRYSVARSIGRISTQYNGDGKKVVMAVAPGRWGTSMPSLGVPVSFAEISTFSVIGELALMHEGLLPDISLGTHFFNDLVEMDMIYLAVSPGKEGHILNEELILSQPNRLTAILPSAQDWMKNVIRIIQPPEDDNKKRIHLYVDSMKQSAICYLDY